MIRTHEDHEKTDWLDFLLLKRRVLFKLGNNLEKNEEENLSGVST